MNQLMEKLGAHGNALSQQVLAQMYQDPFWMDRFGSRGRRHADEDSDFHVRYLRRALAAGDPAVLVRYARWLREVLATRGMCSRHLADNFRRLGELLAAQGWQGGDLAVAFLETARRSLAWEDGPAGRLEPELAGIADGLAAGELEEPARDLCSYLADAVALQRPDLFAAHFDWMQVHLLGRGVAPARWHGVLEDLGRALERSGAHPEALACVRAARQPS